MFSSTKCPRTVGSHRRPASQRSILNGSMPVTSRSDHGPSITMGGSWLYNSRTGFFGGPIGGLPSGVSAQQVTVGHGQAWVLSGESSDNVYVYDDNPTVEKWFHPNPFAVPTLSEIAESTDESLWGVSAGKVYLFDTSTILFGLTAQPAESVFEVKVGTAGVFVLSSGTGHVYSFE